MSGARLLRATCAAALLVPGLLAGASGAPASARAAEGAGLVVESLVPAELEPGGSVTLRGRVEGGEEGLVGARLEVRRAASRSVTLSSLQRWTAAVDPEPGPAAGEGPFEDPAVAALLEAEVEVGDVAANGSVPFVVRLEADELGLDDSSLAAGPYGLQLLLHTGGDGAGEEVVGEDVVGEQVVDDERGFLVWSPELDVAPTGLLTTVPLTAPPVDVATGLPDADVLRGEVVDGGRLDTVLQVAATLDADWVVDPTLLAGLLAAREQGPAPAPTPSVDPSTDPSADPSTQPSAEPSAGAPADPSTPSSTGSRPATGSVAEPSADASAEVPTGSPAPSAAPTGGPTSDADADDPPATADPVEVWLDALAASRRGREVLLTDWANPDPDRLVSADDPADAWAALEAAQDLALPPEELEELLGGRHRDDVVVAPDGRTTGTDLEGLAHGRSSLLLDEQVVPLEDPFALSYTPDLVTEVQAGSRSMTAVLADEQLSADTLAAVEGSPLALTRVLARLATTSLQRPNDPRLLTVRLPGTMRPAPGAADALAQALDRTYWAETVGLSTALGTPPSDAPRAALPEGAPVQEDPGVQQMLDAVVDARLVGEAVGAADGVDGAAQDRALPLQVAAALSRDAPEVAPARIAETLAQRTEQTVAGIRVVPGSRITLVAAQAALPVTVVNELDTPVDLVLQVRSRSPRLQVPEQRVPVTVEPGQRTVVDVPVVAVASGPAEVTSQLVTEAGREWGPASTVTVTVATQAEGRVLTAIGVGVGVLFVLGAARAFVRNRRGRELEARGQVAP